MNTKRLLSFLGIGAAVLALLTLHVNANCCAPPRLSARTDAGENASQAKTLRLTIEGMSCGSCAASINTALQKLDGVRKIAIGAEQKGGTVEYDPAKVNEKTIVETISKTGFKATTVEHS